MTLQNDLLLVKLPKISNIDQDFFGIGYYSDHGFIFLLITEDIINSKPLRKFHLSIGYDSEDQFEILGKIKNLKPPI
jgi:hypothetical protein